MKNVLSIFFIFISTLHSLFGQKYPFEKWDADVLEKANTAKDCSYLSEDEKKVVFYTNLVRMNPKLFAETYLQQYLDSAEVEKSSYVTSLKKDLASAKKANALVPLKELYESAESHAIKMGTSGREGHADYDKRLKKVEKKYSEYTGENCDYGFQNPLDILIDLLIDEGVSGYGHRKNILNSTYYYIGVSIQPHKKYKWNCVMDFCGKE